MKKQKNTVSVSNSDAYALSLLGLITKSIRKEMYEKYIDKRIPISTETKNTIKNLVK